MTNNSNQNFESYVPVYDVIPEQWEHARQIIVEQLKKISNAVNFREIALFIDDEVLTGGQFIPTTEMSSNLSSDSQQFRAILRKVVDVGPIVAGANTAAHGIIVNNDRFTLLHLYGAGTNSVTFNSIAFGGGGDLTLDATNVTVTSTGAYDRCFVTIEYIQEI